MVSLFALWLPILLSAVAVFIVSSIVHMVLRYHNSDHRKVSEEDAFMEAVRKFNLAPGDYFVPRGDGMEAMKSPEFIEKCTKGPILHFTVMKPGPPTMGPQLLQWFLYSIVVGVFAAYVARLTLPAGSEYLVVSRVTGAVAFCCYGMALVQGAIWYKKSWSATLKSLFDSLLYGLFTGGVFGWLWPGA